jgi:hypothetical protein
MFAALFGLKNNKDNIRNVPIGDNLKVTLQLIGEALQDAVNPPKGQSYIKVNSEGKMPLRLHVNYGYASKPSKYARVHRYSPFMENMIIVPKTKLRIGATMAYFPANLVDNSLNPTNLEDGILDGAELGV